MAEIIDGQVFFDLIRYDPFPGSMTQSQVNGINFILDAWERDHAGKDIRWLANALAQTYHETSAEMMPIEEYGKGEGQPYGEPDRVTGQTYYGRGFIQVTWAANYQRADSELGYTGEASCYWHADNQLKPEVSAPTMFRGMIEGWFRSDDDGPQTLPRYFNETTDDPYGAREIINGDKAKVPSWSSGVSIGEMIVGYHNAFLTALRSSLVPEPAPEPEPEPAPEPEASAVTITLTISVQGKDVRIAIDEAISS